jgi:TatD family-associated radical SAM protein
VYRVGKNLYINLTNRCSNRCAFCVREGQSAVGEAESLWLDREPQEEEVLAALRRMGAADCGEIVFCGFGEPTERLDALTGVARQIKSEWPGMRVRLNTNGQGSLIAGRDITPEFNGLIDCASVSLNAANARDYARVCRPEHGEGAFDAVLDFAAKAKAHIPEVVLSIVEGEADAPACENLARRLGLPLRVRGKM